MKIPNFGPGSPIIPELICQRCGGAMRFGNERQDVVECVDNPKHRKHVRKTEIGNETKVSFRKSGPAKRFPGRVAFAATREQERAAERIGADALRLLLDNADKLMLYLCNKSV